MIKYFDVDIVTLGDIVCMFKYWDILIVNGDNGFNWKLKFL